MDVTNRTKRFIAWTTFAIAMGLSTVSAYAVNLPGPLVDSQWLHAHLDDVTIIDVRADPKTFTTPPVYENEEGGQRRLIRVGGHIKGSHLVSFIDIRVAREINGRQIGFMRPSAFEFQNLMQYVGVDGSKPIVVVSPSETNGPLDEGTSSIDMAARLYWTLKTFGTQNIALLNGGVAGWLQSGYDVETAPPDFMPGDWAARKPDLQWSADTAVVASAIKDGVQLLDARQIPQFLGIIKPGVVPEYGHIPGAHAFPTDAITRQDGIAIYYLSKDGYHKVLPQLGISTTKPTITYCNTGHYAAGAWFVMDEIVGVTHTRLYDGSMLEWTTEEHPVIPSGGAVVR